MSPTQTTENQATGQATVVAPAAPSTRTPAQQHTRAETKELNSQLEMLESSRQSITQQLKQLRPGTPEASQLQDRLIELDARISTVDEMLAATRAGATSVVSVPPQTFREIRTGPPTEVYYLGIILTALILFPFSIAYAVRTMKRGATRVSNVASEITDRLARMEATIDATAIEVERIGEGQRFVTRLITEGEASPLFVPASSALAETKISKPSE